MLFGIVMEALSHLLVVAVNEGLLLGFSVNTIANRPLMESHLLFADDTLIFCDADLCQIEKLRDILLLFEFVSSLKINLGKFELVPMGEVSNMGDLVVVLGCRQSLLPLKYFGLPLGAKLKEGWIWNPILEKLQNRLVVWKHLYLFKRGKLTLIKSTLSSLPTYLLSLFPIPVEVASCIEKI